MEPVVTLTPVPSPKPESSPAGLVRKLIQAIAEIQFIPKRGHNNFSNYGYATAEDVVQAVRGPLAKNGILVYSSLVERLSEEIKTLQGKGAWREKITLRFYVTDGDGTLTFDAPGEGQDSGDKAIYKALTGATKYALRQLLQLPIGDDPEVDSPETARHQPSTRSTSMKVQPVEAPHAPQEPTPLSVLPPRPEHQPAMSPPPAHPPEPSTHMATERQVNAILALQRVLGVDDERLLKVVKERYGADQIQNLTRSQASEFLTLMKAEEKRRGS